jgi:hypothetical protein
MVGRVASGGGDAFACGDPDALIHRGGHDDHGWVPGATLAARSWPARPSRPSAAATA